MVELHDSSWESPIDDRAPPLRIHAGPDSNDEKRNSKHSDHFSDPQVVEPRYSDLQVDHSRNISDPQTASTLYSDLEVDPAHGKAERLEAQNLQPYHPGVSADASGPIPYDSEHPQDPPQERKILGLRRNTFFILLTILVLVIIAAIIGGAVGGTVHRHHGSSSSNSSSGSSRAGIMANTSLAAVAWKMNNSTRYKYGVYYQDGDNSIKESLYDSQSGSWNVTTVASGLGIRPGTPLAASSPKYADQGRDTVVSPIRAGTVDAPAKSYRISTYITFKTICPSQSRHTMGTYGIKQSGPCRPRVTQNSARTI